MESGSPAAPPPGEPPLPPLSAPPPASPWGFWTTLGFSCLIAVGLVGTQTATVLLFIAAREGSTAGWSPGDLGSEGVVLSVGTLVSLPVVAGLCALFAWLRRGIKVRDYLAWNAIPPSEVSRWFIRLLCLLVASDALTTLLGKPIVDDSMIQAYRTAGSLPLLWAAVIIAAPVSEELLFRGFIFRGLAASPLGGLGATLFTSVVWAGIHLQYDWYGKATILVTGLLLGWARLRTNSVLTTILMHAVMNLFATIQVAAQLAWFS